ncbi:MAG: hypothetical protein QS721_09220 [Candidatus Endonucleobacter sp. (ex Gigantidas childressi)]|nr:hypothetical protein [Candidatus Endonucleobacter sp. (ex Gigantidas childressi)]
MGGLGIGSITLPLSLLGRTLSGFDNISTPSMIIAVELDSPAETVVESWY